jgi:AcrR family transcriptional regulator
MIEKTDKRKAILTAMLDLVVERGFHNAPMSHLAKRSGASPGVIYHYFQSKDDLIRAVYTRVSSQKREALLSGFSADMSPWKAFLQVWLNAYHFYRTHPHECRFLDQYQSSPYCDSSTSDNRNLLDPAAASVLKLMRPKKKGGILKDLPAEAINSFTFGLAASLATSKKSISPPALKRIAETAWSAISQA